MTEWNSETILTDDVRTKTMSRLAHRIERGFEGLIRAGVGCFVFIVVSILVIGFLASRPEPYHPTVAGPRVPIPTVDQTTLDAGSRLYQTEECANSHGGIGNIFSEASAPDLTHEGRRNADIDWQIRNLRDHTHLFPGGGMPDYTDLSPTQLRALASYMATRD